ncbi:MAG: hypothetical protein MUF15_24800 [Acidobacteria bacterium]|jgi:hypothetical protein|nr:hypothetical protein [Acidobacteriota bacterium]
MRKIDKTRIISTQYKNWLDQLNHDNVKHPSQSDKYYDDVLMSLLHCQKGVCAYTEMIICNPALLSEDKWENGRYKCKSERFGSLEHFDPKLKEDKYWDWDNLFVVSLDINVKKGDKEVDDILKPDTPQYDPFKLLEYNEQTHLFVPHRDIEDNTLRERIKKMIKVLHINHDTVCYKRKTFFYQITWQNNVDRSIIIDRFFTAYHMVMEAKQKNNAI